MEIDSTTYWCYEKTAAHHSILHNFKKQEKN